jgi:FixJ family two-component response regulator
MPGMKGWDLAQHLLVSLQHLKRLFMSGYSDDVVTRRGGLETGGHFIHKPFSLSELAIVVRTALDDQSMNRVSDVCTL